MASVSRSLHASTLFSAVTPVEMPAMHCLPTWPRRAAAAAAAVYRSITERSDRVGSVSAQARRPSWNSRYQSDRSKRSDPTRQLRFA